VARLIRQNEVLEETSAELIKTGVRHCDHDPLDLAHSPRSFSGTSRQEGAEALFMLVDDSGKLVLMRSSGFGRYEASGGAIGND
jgi:hypothetical protein